MLINLYKQLFVMSLVAGGLYLILKIISKGTIKYFTASWHYYTYTVIYLSFLLPYHKLISLLRQLFSQKTGNDLALPVLPSILNIPIYSINDLAVTNETMLIFDFLSYLLPAGTIIFIIVVLFQNRKMYRSISDACQLINDAQVLEIFARCKENLRISRKISLYSCPLTNTPFIYGLLKPCVVLPQTEFTIMEFEHMFCHELVHWKRRDGWLKYLALFINGVHWYNPLAYIVRHDIGRACELSCDEILVIKMSNEERMNYCELLLNVSQKIVIAAQDAKVFSAFNDMKQFERRINTIMKSNDLKQKRWIRLFALTMTLTFLLAGAITAYAACDNYDVGSVEGAVIIDADIIFSSDTEGAIGVNKNVSLIENDNVLYDGDNIDSTQESSGNLVAGKSFSYDKQYLAKSQTVSIYAEWTPDEANIELGLKSSDGTITAITLSDGEGSVACEIMTSDYYYIYIGVPSKSDVSFEVSYIVN